MRSTIVEYPYDYQDPDDLGSVNNRLGKSNMKIGSTAALNSATFCWYTNAGNVEVAGKRLKGETTMTGTKFVYALHKRTVAYATGVY